MMKDKEEKSPKKSQQPMVPQFLDNACDATRVLMKRRQLYDIKEKLAKEKVLFEQKCLILKEREDELTKRELEFQLKVCYIDRLHYLSSNSPILWFLKSCVDL